MRTQKEKPGISIDNQQEDARKFNLHQLDFFAKKQKRRFDHMSFMHMTDDNLCLLFGYNTTAVPIPFLYRVSGWKVREFIRLHQRREKLAIKKQSMTLPWNFIGL